MQRTDGKKEQRRNTWTNEDGSIRPISKWSGVELHRAAESRLRGGKDRPKLENVTDKQGFHATMYIKVQPGERDARTATTRTPTTRSTVAPSNESRTQVAVNNDGKTNEATKERVNEPLQKGQTAPKDDTPANSSRRSRRRKRAKGMKDVIPRCPPLNPK